jgi:flagellar basal body-associated protein FliL
MSDDLQNNTENLPEMPVQDPTNGSALTTDGIEPDRQPIDVEAHAEEAKSRRSKRLLIVLLVLLVLIFAGGAFIGVRYFILPHRSLDASFTFLPELPVQDPSVTTNSSVSVKYKTTTIPPLVGLFGMNKDEVAARLGSDWTLTKEEAVSDATTPAAVAMLTFTYTAQPIVDNQSSADQGTTNTATDTKSSSSSADTTPDAQLYLSMNADNKVIDVLYKADMDLLGFPTVSFMDLLATDSTINKILDGAGVGPKDFQYAAPNVDETIAWDNPNSDKRKITRQSKIYSGRTTNNGDPTAWTVTFTYEFTPYVQSPDDFSNARRTIKVQLS